MSLLSRDSRTMGRVQPEAPGQLEFGTTQMEKKYPVCFILETNMNILEVAMHFSTDIYTKHVLCANTRLCTAHVPHMHVPQFPHTLNKESRGSSLRGNPPVEWEVCNREGKTAKGELSIELSSFGQMQQNPTELSLPGKAGSGHVCMHHFL